MSRAEQALRGNARFRPRGRTPSPRSHCPRCRNPAPGRARQRVRRAKPHECSVYRHLPHVFPCSRFVLPPVASGIPRTAAPPVFPSSPRHGLLPFRAQLHVVLIQANRHVFPRGDGVRWESRTGKGPATESVVGPWSLPQRVGGRELDLTAPAVPPPARVAPRRERLRPAPPASARRRPPRGRRSPPVPPSPACGSPRRR